MQALKDYQNNWVQKRLEGKILSRGKSVPDDIIRKDIICGIFLVLPERQRLAQMIPLDKILAHSEMLSAVKDLFTYIHGTMMSCIVLGKSHWVVYVLQEAAISHYKYSLDRNKTTILILADSKNCHLLLDAGHRT
ncbi:hypothetical protein VTN96DRAFT_7618 [Rasamsonia emersonii]